MVLKAEIVDFNIYRVNSEAITAVLKVDIGGNIMFFGGKNMFQSVPDADSSKLFTAFVFRCMELFDAKHIMDLAGMPAYVSIKNNVIDGICSTIDNNWFYPLQEFTSL